MKKILSILLIFPIIIAFAITANGKGKMGMHHEGMLKNVWHICGCEACDCNNISAEPGKCKCGSELVPLPLIKIEGNKGYFCRCSDECLCKLDSEDPTKCICGKQIRVIDLSGKYVCSCCNIISEKPGRCFCGKELEKL